MNYIGKAVEIQVFAKIDWMKKNKRKYALLKHSDFKNWDKVGQKKSSNP